VILKGPEETPASCAELVRAFADVKAISAEAAERTVGALERERRYLQDTY